MLGKLKTNHFLIKLSSWEYWPSWILYVPVYIQHVWLTIKTKNLFFFLATNPKIDGFILSDSKFETLKILPEKLRPKAIFVLANADFKDVVKELDFIQIKFPLILKPDIGFRGLLVHKVETLEDLEFLVSKIKVNHIIQEYISYEEEFGVFYYRFPNQKTGAIFSLTLKEFLKVTGDGKHTLEELMLKSPRAVLQLEKKKKEFLELWNVVVPKGKKIVLEPIGNHNRGTKFVNANSLISEKLVAIFDDLSYKTEGLFFARFDIKTASFEDLENGTNFKILEINGIGAEPTHIYDPSFKLWKAWKVVLHSWRISAKIAKINMHLGVKAPTIKEGWSKWVNFKAYKKNAFK